MAVGGCGGEGEGEVAFGVGAEGRCEGEGGGPPGLVGWGGVPSR